MKTMIHHNQPTFGIEEKQAVANVIDSGWVAQGKEVQKFEDEFCEFIGLPKGHAAAVSSCTAATYIALSLLGAKGKTVAYPAYTCTAVRNAIDHSGGIGQVVDSGKVLPNIDVKQLNKLNPDFAVIPHMYGFPVDIPSIDDHIVVIEDCAQALGASIRGKSVGLHGAVGVFSFYASKIMTSGGSGGMLVSKEKKFIDLVKDYRNFDQKMDDIRRFNFQMTDIQAGFGRAQLHKLPEFIRRRQEIYAAYVDAGVRLLGCDYGFVPYRAILLSQEPNKVIAHLATKGITAINPLRYDEVMMDNRCDPIYAKEWSYKTLSLPIYPILTNEDIQRIITEVLSL